MGDKPKTSRAATTTTAAAVATPTPEALGGVLNQSRAQLQLYFAHLTDNRDLYTGADGQKILDRLEEFNDLLRQCHLVQARAREAERALAAVKVVLARGTSHRSEEALQNRLRGAYELAQNEANIEAQMLRHVLNNIVEIRNLCMAKQRKMKMGNGNPLRRGQLMKLLSDTANILPLFVGEGLREPAPPLCGSIPAPVDYISKIGDLVAALTPIEPDPGSVAAGLLPSEPDNHWILSEVINYYPDDGIYEVEDIDEDQLEAPPRYRLPRANVIPLPLMRANPETDSDALFSSGTIVLALYPQTTCFYQAVVKRPPKTATEQYLVLFEDSSYTEGFSPPLNVPQRYVLNFRDKNPLQDPTPSVSGAKTKKPNKTSAAKASVAGSSGSAGQSSKTTSKRKKSKASSSNEEDEEKEIEMEVDEIDEDLLSLDSSSLSDMGSISLGSSSTPSSAPSSSRSSSHSE